MAKVVCRLLSVVAVLLAIASTRTEARQADTIDVRDHGARCDGVTDDAQAFQATFAAAAAARKDVAIAGVCVVDAPVSVKLAGGMRVTGGTVLTDGRDFLHIAYDDPGGDAHIDLAHLRITNRSRTQGGTAVFMDGAAGTGSSHNTAKGVRVSNFLTAFRLHDIGGSVFSDIEIDAFGSAQSRARAFDIEGIAVHGVQRYAANLMFSDVQVIGGYGLWISGGVQGIVLRDFKVLVGQWGVHESDGINFEGLTATASYFEGVRGGITIEDAHAVQLIGNAFDATISQAPVLASVQTIHLGATRAGNSDNQVIGNNVQDFGPATGAVIYVAGGENVVSGNTVLGLVPHAAACIELDTRLGYEPAVAAYDTVSGNMCWHAGGYKLDGPLSPSGSGNLYTGTDGRQRDWSPASGAYTVATLPAGCTAGQTVFVSDARNKGEAPGAGTGAMAFCNGRAAWLAYATGIAVAN